MSGWPSADLRDQLDQARAENEELRDLVVRAHALVAQASHMVDDDRPNWHRHAESFLGDCLGFLR